MIKNIWNYIDSIAIGIKFQPNFGFPEKSGALFDEILYGDDSYFDKSFFKNVGTKIDGEKKLYNEDNPNSLLINNENIIFEYASNDKKDLDEVVEKFNSQLIQDKFYDYELTRIHRLGFIYRYIIEDQDLVDNIVSSSSSSPKGKVKDLQLRFSKKIITSSLSKSDENDYQNVIYTAIKQTNSDSLLLRIDYQHYYEPLITDTKIIDFKSFKKKIDKYNSLEVKSWINKFYEK
jgi:hypothetical protein